MTDTTKSIYLPNKRQRKILTRLLVFILTILAGFYIYIELLLLSSYKDYALGAFGPAMERAEKAEEIAAHLYPLSSDSYQDIFLYDIKLRSKLGLLGVYLDPARQGAVLSKAYAFERKARAKRLTREETARVHVEVARLANATAQGFFSTFSYDLIDKSKPVINDKWSMYASEEEAYHLLVGIFGTLDFNDPLYKVKNDAVLSIAVKEHTEAQQLICKFDKVQCRFNELRWKIGVCIRQAYMKQSPACTAENLAEVADYPSNYNGLSIQESYEVMDNLMPYYQRYFLAQADWSKQE